MKVSSETLRNCEWEKVIEKLSSLCHCEATRNSVTTLDPLPQPGQIEDALRETGECLEMVRFDRAIDLNPFPDLREALARTSIPGSTLPLADLVRIALFLNLVRRVISSFREHRIREKYPLLYRIREEVADFSSLGKVFHHSLSEDGRILDSASPGLTKARRTIRRIEEELKEALGSFLNHPDHSQHLQEHHYTIRRGRYVVPVKTQSRNLVEGLVIDSSSTGSTVFIEPRSVLFLNNELEVALFREREEVEKVLYALTDAVRKEIAAFHRSFQALVRLDFLQAKALLAREWEAGCPKLTSEAFSLTALRHPLLGKRAVPLDLVVSPANRILVVSGPNAGGKTVLLKTIALAVVLTHCGLFPPVAAGSEIPFFQSLHVDIGDHQDLENDLSTFTSRITRLRGILEETGQNTLVLIDELGSGTDPEEGAALAKAVLEHLRDHRVTSVVTTHFPSVKEFATQEEGMETASMEFDPVRLAPTFRLSVGEIGGSFGLEIAARVGLSRPLIERAMSFMDQARVDLNRLILEQQWKKESLHKTEQALLERLEQVIGEQAEVETLRQELEKHRRKQLEEHRERLSRFLKDTRDEVGRLVGALRKDKSLDEQAYRSFKDRIEQEEVGLNELEQLEKPVGNSVPPNPGDQVYVSDLNKGGTVLSVDWQRNRVLVDIDGRKIVVSLARIRRHDRGEPVKGNGIRYALESGQRISPEIEIRQMRVGEAREQLQKYFDRVVLAGYSTVIVIHGRGGGVLRRVTQEFLREHPQVASFRDGSLEEGGIGVTVVDLK